LIRIPSGEESVPVLNIIFALPDVELKFGVSGTVGKMNHPVFILVTINPRCRGLRQEKNAE
jgi:hypothetical protein